MPYKDPEVRKLKQKQYAKSYYQRNKQKVVDSAAKSKADRKRKWLAFKARLSCINCGESHSSTLDFHHVKRHKDNPKIHTLINNNGWDAIMKEVEKCVVLCANCHRKLHHQERITRQRL